MPKLSFAFPASSPTLKAKLKAFGKRKAEQGETERITFWCAAKEKRIQDTPKPLEKDSTSGKRPRRKRG